MSIIQVDNLVKTYHLRENKFLILDQLSLTVGEGEIVSVEGKSGIGKSTLLNIMGALDDFDSGEVQVCGVDLAKLSEKEKERFRAEKVSFIFQQHLLLPDFSAIENVMLPLLIRGLNPRKAREDAMAMLDRVGLQDRHANFPSQLSGGESARVGVARALASGKKLVLADEPTGNLDRANSRMLMDLILELQSEMGFSMVLVTHDLELAKLAHKRNHILAGRLQPIQNGDPLAESGGGHEP